MFLRAVDLPQLKVHPSLDDLLSRAWPTGETYYLKERADLQIHRHRHTLGSWTGIWSRNVNSSESFFTSLSRIWSCAILSVLSYVLKNNRAKVKIARPIFVTTQRGYQPKRTKSTYSLENVLKKSRWLRRMKSCRLFYQLINFMKY